MSETLKQKYILKLIKAFNMTYKELLDSVSFDEIVPYIEKNPGGKGCLALYKIHYDMLCHLTSNPEDDSRMALLTML